MIFYNLQITKGLYEFLFHNFILFNHVKLQRK